MKQFLLREMAFFVSPVMLLTKPKLLLSKVLAAIALIIFMKSMTSVAMLLVTHSINWFDMAIGLFFAALSFLFFAFLSL